MRSRAVVLATAPALAPLSAQSADLVIGWEKGYYDEENEAVGEIIAAFEHKTGKQVEIALADEEKHRGAIVAALAAGQPPDFAFGTLMASYISEWAFDDRLADLSDAVGHFSDLFDPDALDRATLVNAKTGRRAVYAVPMGRVNNHLHVWRSLLEQAGFTLTDIPREWNAFWSFWCDEVQPAIRQAAGRDDIWGIGLPMSVAYDTQFEFFQFAAADRADYVTPDGRLVIDDLENREKLVMAMDSYTAIYRKGCTPPASVAWDNLGGLGQYRQQQGVPFSGGRHDAEQHAVDSQRAQARASR